MFKMAYAYVLVTAGKILDLLPINVTDEPPKKKEDRKPVLAQKREEGDLPKEPVSRLCTKCKEIKAGTEFYRKGYCKACVKIYNARTAYDKTIRRELFKKEAEQI